MHKSIFLVDVLISSSKITKKLDFQPYRIEFHNVKSKLDICRVVKKLVKSNSFMQILDVVVEVLDEELICLA
jgi:hypothetical protein